MRRYYEHRDALMHQKLAEIVSDLYLCEDEKKAERLWKSARTALLNAGAPKPRVETIIASRNLERLAALLAELF